MIGLLGFSTDPTDGIGVDKGIKLTDEVVGCRILLVKLSVARVAALIAS
jgi:hypothetical protein